MEFIKRNTDYALRALVYMAEDGGGRPYPVGEIAEATGTPETFLRKVVQRLDAAGVVATKRGVGGGVSFLKKTEAISVFEVVEAVQGPVAINKCFISNRECADREGCHIRRTLGAMQDEMVDLFKTATVGKLAKHTKPIGEKNAKHN
jgi:Rrf2 family transcriptional regulator, iron-sulfur cluster assembly transcription factor